jgi:putative transposase
MPCPYCEAATTPEQTERTALGYRKFRCDACRRLFNERTGTPFNFLEYPTDIVLLDIAEELLFRSVHDFVRLDRVIPTW